MSSTFDAFKHCTVKGKIKYASKPTPFGWPDLERIIKSIHGRRSLPRGNDLERALAIQILLLDLLHDAISREIEDLMTPVVRQLLGQAVAEAFRLTQEAARFLRSSIIKLATSLLSSLGVKLRI